MKKLLSTLFLAALLKISAANSLELTKPHSDPSLPYTKIEIKPTLNFTIGAGSAVKDTTLKAGDFQDDIKCYFLISRILLNKLEMGIESEINAASKKGGDYIHAFWKTPKFEAQLFAPKSVSNKMFSNPIFTDKSSKFDEIAKSDQIYTTSHKFLADGLCKEADRELISKKASIYLRSGAENNKFEFGFSFMPASHSKEPSIKRKADVKKADFLKSVKSSFVGSDIVSCAQSYEHKTKKGVSLKICTIQEFGSVKALDLNTIIPPTGATTTYNFTDCSYTSSKDAYALGLSGVLGIKDTEFKAAVSKTSVKDVLSNFCISCSIEQKFQQGYKVALSYFQSYDDQNLKLVDTSESTYRSVALYLEKELRKEIALYVGINGYRGYKSLGDSTTNKGLGLCLGTKITL